MPVTPWVYWGQSKTSTNITRYTIAAIGALITGIVSASSLGTAATITYTVINAIVQKICDDCIPKVWYTDDVYYKYIQSPTHTNRVAELTYHAFYSDSNRTANIGYSTSKVWLNGYVD